ncbi:hypothetical protein [Pseudoxanthomonas sp. z9]|uniref:hypothetical protein n=1 Tax=Pseudoxanthomonas sp. z9 TaxID=2584942 RepID=UPI0011414936|nr:hypothetical protein [Pseudoxanthomonas sp. z9]MCL6711099.1 hypothetical protein [Pseudomonas sp. R2.Fl]
MRTLILIVLGLVLAALAMHFSPAGKRGLWAGGFALAWLGVVGWNLRTGLSHGYSLGEELPIQLLIYAVPVATALAWWLRTRSH